MLVLDDIGELWDLRPRAGFGIRAVAWQRTDSSVWDCSWFRDKQWWPAIKKMKPSGARVFEYITLLRNFNAVDESLPRGWNDCDGKLYAARPEEVKLEHYTAVPTQPYRPYPTVDYKHKTWPYHPCYEVGQLWWDEYDKAKAHDDQSATAG